MLQDGQNAQLPGHKAYFAASPSTFPTNWVAPVDYAHGIAYVRVDVLAKPSAKKTLYNVCPEGNGGGANCLPLSPAYSGPGLINFSGDMPSSWNFSSVDWTKGVKRIALILKDENQAKVQGNADFYPTTIHATVTFVAKGGTYVPPSTSADAGEPMLDAATSPADSGSNDAGNAHADDGGARDAAPPEPPASDASSQPTDSGTATLPAAGSTATMTPSPAGHAANAGTGSADSGAWPKPPAALSDLKGSCSIGGFRSSTALGASWMAAALALLARRRRRQR